MKKLNIFIGFIFFAFILLISIWWHNNDIIAAVLETKDYWMKDMYYILSIFSLTVFLLVFLILKLNIFKMNLEYIFAISVLLLGLGYMLVLPPLSAPDEVGHYISSYRLSNTLLFKQAVYEDGHVLIRACDLFLEDINTDYMPEGKGTEEEPFMKKNISSKGVVLGQLLTQDTYKRIRDNEISRYKVMESEDMNKLYAISYHPPVNTTPIVYLPQATGISIARILDLNSIALVYMGRAFNLIFFIIAVFFAIKIIPLGKEILFGISLLPMTLHLVSSFSYDTGIIAFIFLFIAYILHLCYKKSRIDYKDIIILSALSAMFAPCKLVYMPIVFIIFLLPLNKFKNRGQWAISMLFIIATIFLAIFIVNTKSVIPYIAEGEKHIQWADKAGYSLKDILSDRKNTFKLFYNTLVWQAYHYHMTMIGAFLGNIDEILEIPYIVIAAFSGSLILLALNRRDIYIRGIKRYIIYFLCIGSFFAILLSMFLVWTPIDSKIINGVQGRYFLPILPLILIVSNNKTISINKDIKYDVLFYMAALNLYSLIRLYSIVCIRIL